VHAYRTHVVLSRMVEDRAMWGACSLSRGLSDGDAHTGRPGATKRLLIWARVASIPAGRPSRAPGRLCSVRTPTCCLLPPLLRTRGGRARRDARCGPILFPPPLPPRAYVQQASGQRRATRTAGRAVRACAARRGCGGMAAWAARPARAVRVCHQAAGPGGAHVRRRAAVPDRRCRPAGWATGRSIPYRI
jgi:hypothetical protein